LTSANYFPSIYQAFLSIIKEKKEKEEEDFGEIISRKSSILFPSHYRFITSIIIIDHYICVLLASENIIIFIIAQRHVKFKNFPLIRQQSVIHLMREREDEGGGPWVRVECEKIIYYCVILHRHHRATVKF
jgi:hypothetical protein